jgi:hypothetical protein
MTTVNTINYLKVKPMKVILVVDAKVSVVEGQQVKSLYLGY